MRTLLAAILLTATAVAAPKPHHCEADARARAESMLKWYWDSPDAKLQAKPGEPDGSADMAWSLDDETKILPPVKAPGTGEKYDVLEIYAYVYKATYRIHLLYLQMPDDCALGGAEIVEQ